MHPCHDRYHTPSIVVLTGAGVSADSGLATFRGAGGLWEGHRVEEVATPEAWAVDPHLVWRFYQLRRGALGEVEPNPAHAALAQLEITCAKRDVEFLLVTQNVDDLHERAGSDPAHMHGELSMLRCERCGHREHNLRDLEPDDFVPCPRCNHDRLRPDIVWFGELPMHLDKIDRRLRRATHFLAIGTSGLVYPAASFLTAARAAGARTLVNSLDEPDNLHPSDEFHAGRAALVVPRLVDELLSEVLG